MRQEGSFVKGLGWAVVCSVPLYVSAWGWMEWVHSWF